MAIDNKTIRHEILAALIEDIEGEEWVKDEGVSVNPGKMRYHPSELPGISVFAHEEVAERNAYGTLTGSFEVELKYVGVITRDKDGDKASTFALAEVKRGQLIESAVNSELGDYAEKPIYTGGSTDYPATEDQAAQISVTVNINYETLLRDPYSQD